MVAKGEKNQAQREPSTSPFGSGWALRSAPWSPPPCKVPTLSPPIWMWVPKAPTQASAPGSPPPFLPAYPAGQHAASSGPTLDLAPPSLFPPSSSLPQPCKPWPLGRQNSELSAVVPSAPVWNAGRGHTGAGRVAEILALVTPVSVANLKEAEACVGTTQVLVDSHGVELALKVSQAHP